MKKIIFISFINLFCLIGVTKYTLATNNICQINISDSTPPNIKAEDKVIDEVIESPNPPKQEKVKYVSEVTKYGFKDLFKNYSYNSSIPYASQVNPHAETYMQDYLQAHGKYLEQMKATALPYFNLIDGILTKYGLPKELKYLAVIESDLKSNALSIAGARGPWQFMTYTAKDYGLKVNQFVDDRTDYYKSTNAAAKYLLNLYKDFNDWLLVIAAYNGGSGRVNTAIKKSGSRNFWKLQYYLPEESRNHVKKFIATHYVMETEANRDNFNYTSLNGSSDPSKPDISEEEITASDSLLISGKYIAFIISKNIEMDVIDFNRYNPGFDNAMATGNAFNMRLPNDKMSTFIANKYLILNECVETLLKETNIDTKSFSKKTQPVKNVK